MEGNVTIFNYGGCPVTFCNEDGSVMVNATQMAKRFGKQSSEWLRLPSTRDFLSELSSMGKSLTCDNQLVITKMGSPDNGGGTWLHEDVALEFARWLSPKFAIWCNDRIKELLTQGVTTIANDDETILRAIKVLERRVEESKALVAHKDEIITEQETEIRRLTPKANAFDQISSSDTTYTATQLAKEFGYPNVRAFYDKLIDQKIVFRQSNSYLPYKKWANKDCFAYRTHTTERSDGRIETHTYLVFTEKFRALILRSRHRRAMHNQ